MNANEVMLCMLTDAVEGSGIAYWAEARNVRRRPDLYVTSFEVRDGGYEGPRESEAWHKINATTLKAAIVKLRNGAVPVRRDIAAQFVGAEWDYDCEGIDCAVQVAVFGKLVYG